MSTRFKREFASPRAVSQVKSGGAITADHICWALLEASLGATSTHVGTGTRQMRTLKLQSDKRRPWYSHTAAER